VPEFAVRVGTPAGDVLEQTISAENEAALRRECERRDLYLISATRRSDFARVLRDASPLRPRVSAREFLFFNQELSALLKAGLPILSSLELLIERKKNPTFKKALIDIRDRIKAGESLSDAFKAQGHLFPTIYSAALASGERSGEIPLVLRRYIADTRKLMAVRRKVVSALMYPAILVGLSVVLVGILVVYVVPSFTSFFEQLGGPGSQLPLPTRMLMGLANFVQHYFALIIVGAILAAVGFTFWKNTASGRLMLDRWKLRIPLLGSVSIAYGINQFARTLGTLVSGGIPLVTSLEITGGAVSNVVFRREVLAVAGKVKEGQPMWDSLDKTGLFTPMSVEMIKVGESTGSLEEMLTSVSEFLDEEIDTNLTRIVTFIEPIILIIMAIVVGGMLLAIYYPLLQAYGGQLGNL
jgi:type IV pilus assembly protein PilC